MKYDYGVLGNGLLGAAIALELTSVGRRVCLIGAPHGARDAIFCGHHDDSRMVRYFHADPFWEKMTRLNTEFMVQLPVADGNSFFRPTPVLYRFRTHATPSSSTVRTRSAAQIVEHGNTFPLCDEAGGIVEPIRYIAAMNQHATLLGLKLFNDVVLSVDRMGGHFQVNAEARQVQCARIINTRGFHNAEFLDSLRIRGKVQAFADRSADASARAYCFLDMAVDDISFQDVYGFCDYRAHEGRLISKFGFTEAHPVELRPEKISTWFRDAFLAHPDLSAFSKWLRHFDARLAYPVIFRPCAFATTVTGRPLLHEDRDQFWIAGCNGMAAKCCQAIAKSALASIESAFIPESLRLESQIGRIAA